MKVRFDQANLEPEYKDLQWQPAIGAAAANGSSVRTADFQPRIMLHDATDVRFGEAAP